jgi:hypothetical protein
MIKKILLTFFLVLVQTVVFGATKTYIGPNNGVWNTAANWSPSGVPSSSDDVIIPTGNTVTVNVNAQAKSIVVVGNLTLATTYTLIVYGDFTVTAATTGPNVPEGNFKIVENGNSTTTLIVLGNYINNGKTDFDKGDVIIVGNLITPETSTLQNLGNVIVGGDIIGDFNLQGSIQTNQQIYAVNPNATVTITPDNIDKDVVPGTPVTTTTESSTLVDLVNLYIYGGNCTFTVNNIANVSACLGSNAVFTVTTNANSPQYQWQVKMNGPGWTNLTNEAPYSGVNTATLTISGVTAAMNNYQYRAKVTGGSPSSCTKNGNYGVLTVKAAPTTPTITAGGPTTFCTGGSVTLTSSAGTTYLWSTGATTQSISPTASGSYTVQVTNAANCQSASSAAITVTVNALNTPTLSPVTQPTCSVATGSFTITNYDVGYTYNVNPSTGVIVSGSTITAPTGSYTVTATLGSCTSSPSLSVTIKSATNEWDGLAWSNVTTPISTENIVFNGDYNSTGNLTACSCQVNAGVYVDINSGHTLTLTNKLVVSDTGNILFKDKSSLVQINNVVNTGKIEYERKVSNTIRDTDYTYWSSPVAGFKLGDVYPDNTTGLFYSYGVTSGVEDWQQESFSTVMDAGKGYIINGAQPTSGPNPPPSTNPFVGVPNNGDIQVPVTFVNPLNLPSMDPNYGVSYLLGNPYPSALDAETFLDHNSGFLDGTIYFWTHNTALDLATNITNPGPGWAYTYSLNDYAAYNSVGGVGVGSGTGATSGGSAPTGKIASGQGFFATCKATGTVTFNNSMRVTGNNSQFFKTKNPNKSAKTIEKKRIWLNLTNTQGAFKQTLVGYVTNATNDYDSHFDGQSFDGNEFVDFYSVNQDKNLVIQGRALPFDENDEVPLGFRTTINGVFTINIDQVDGFLKNQAVFIEDKLTNTVFDLKSGNYTFNTVAGTFNDRFILRYTDNSGSKTLETANFDSLEKTVLVSNKNKQIKINSSVEMINMVTIFDLLGRQIYQKANVNSNELSISNLVLSHQIVMVKTVLQNGETVTKKIIY